MMCDFDTWVAEERVHVTFGIPTKSTTLCLKTTVHALCDSDQYLLSGSHAKCHVHQELFLCS